MIKPLWWSVISHTHTPKSWALWTENLHFHFKSIIPKRETKHLKFWFYRNTWEKNPTFLIQMDLFGVKRNCVFLPKDAASYSQDQPHLQRPPLHIWKWVLPQWRVALPHRAQDCWSGSKEVKVKKKPDRGGKSSIRIGLTSEGWPGKHPSAVTFTHMQSSFTFGVAIFLICLSLHYIIGH